MIQANKDEKSHKVVGFEFWGVSVFFMLKNDDG